MRVLTEIPRLPQAVHPDMVVTLAPDLAGLSDFRRALKYFSIIRDYDYFLMNSSNCFYFLGLLKLLAPWRRCKVASLDAFLTHPDLCTNLPKKLARWVRIMCLKGVDRIFLYSKNNDALSRAYHIPLRKLKYIPFKVNGYEIMQTTSTGDEGYIFAGGYSRRDYPTLVKACRDLPYPVRIVVPVQDEAKLHETLLDEGALPPNVQVVHDDGSLESFIAHIAQAKFVVVPTKKRDFASTGTSVYLMSMALGKCVIISAGPTTDQLLTDDMAVIVPPEDPNALKAAIQRLYADNEYRCRLAQTGQKYALSLGDEKAFYNMLLREIASELAR